MKLRPYQIAALQASKEKADAGILRQLLVLPTGTGKTVVFACLPKHHGYKKKILVLDHREELTDQAADKILKWNPGVPIGIEMAHRRCKPTDQIIVASVPTIGRKGSPRLEQFNPLEFDAIICDEAHHSVSQSYLTVFDHFGLFSPDNHIMLLGVTATPNRGDGKALAQVYDQVIYSLPFRDAIEQGWLADVRGIRLTTNVGLDGVKIQGGDFAVGDLSNTVNTPARNQEIVRAWIDRAWERQTIAFTVDIQHAKDLAMMFQKNSIPCEAVWGDDPERARKLADHRAGKTTVLVNCGVLTEGYDDWRVSCIIMARPTKSQLLFMQCVGRGTRIPEGINNLAEAQAQGIKVEKTDCILLDVVDATSKHSLVTLPSLLGMNPKMDLKGKSVVQAARHLEKVQEEHPLIDFSTLKDITKVEAHIEAVNLWEVRFPDEITENSTMQWHKSPSGNYVLLLPDKGQNHLSQNALERWEVEATIKGNHVKESDIDTFSGALQTGEQFLDMFGKEYKKILTREAKWHDEPMTPPQERFLRKLYKGKTIPPGLLKGQAAKLISSALAGKLRT
jgi:ATP-dependent helicase IRC3